MTVASNWYKPIEVCWYKPERTCENACLYCRREAHKQMVQDILDALPYNLQDMFAERPWNDMIKSKVVKQENKVMQVFRALRLCFRAGLALNMPAYWNFKDQDWYVMVELANDDRHLRCERH